MQPEASNFLPKDEDVKQKINKTYNVINPLLNEEYEDYKKRIDLDAMGLQNQFKQLENEAKKIDNESLGLKNDGQLYINKARKGYAIFVSILLCIWLLLIIFILIFTGFNTFDFHLSDAIILALIGSITTGVAGFFFAVINYLFPNK